MATATESSCVRTLPVRPSDEPRRVPMDGLIELTRQPWTLRIGRQPMIVRPSSARDLAAVARMHSRCSARTMLDRYRSGGRAPAVAALDRALRNPLGVVVALPDGTVVAAGSLERDRVHSYVCAEVALLVEDAWQRRGIAGELLSHLAGVAQVEGFTELIAHPATAVPVAQRLMTELGRTRMVPGPNAHMHTYLSTGATLGLGAVRQRLAG